MARFKVLQFNQDFMVKIGLHSYNITEPTNEFFHSFVACFVLFILTVFSVTSSAVFVYKNVADFGSALQAIFVLIAGVQCEGMFLTVGLQMKSVKALQIKLQSIVDEVQEDQIVDVYWKSEQNCRKYTKTLVINYMLLLLAVFLSLFVYSIYFILIGNFNPSELPLPYNMVVPYDTETVWGWYLLWLTQCMMSTSYAVCVLSTTSYFVCCCIYIGTICEHCDLLFSALGQDITQIGEKNTVFSDVYSVARRKFHRVIKIHAQIYEIFETVADINDGTIFSLLPLNAIFMGICLYGIEHSDFNVVSFTTTVLYLVTSSVWPYLFCFCASYAIDRIYSIGNTAYSSSWYDYPHKWQKYIPLIVARSQQSIAFTGFNCIACTLITFGKLFQSSCSYYLIFRRLSEH